MVASHLLLTGLHGLVHGAIPVIPAGWTAAFAMVSLFVLPVTGAGLVLIGHHRIGGAVLFIAGIASFGFEGAAHFLIRNPDNVAQVADHHTSFEATAILTTMGNFLLVVAAWFAVRGHSLSVSKRNVLQIFDFG